MTRNRPSRPASPIATTVRVEMSNAAGAPGIAYSLGCAFLRAENKLQRHLSPIAFAKGADSIKLMFELRSNCRLRGPRTESCAAGLASVLRVRILGKSRDATISSRQH